MVLKLADRLSDRGTQLDFLWIEVFQNVAQLLLATNKNFKTHYIAISAKIIHSSAEIVRLIEQEIREHDKLDYFYSTVIRCKVRELSSMITVDMPKKLMTSTRMAIGVWPPPEAISEMLRESVSLASAVKDLVLLGNSLGYFPVLDKIFEITIKDIVEEIKEANTENNIKGGLNYTEYKRQNNLRLLESLSKGYDNSNLNARDVTFDPKKVAEDFSQSLDSLLRQFVGSVADIKNLCDQHLRQEYVNATSIMNERAERIIEEILGNDMLKDLSDDIKIIQTDVSAIESSGIKLGKLDYPVAPKLLIAKAIEEVREASKKAMMAGDQAASPQYEATSEKDMLQCTIPSVIAIKKLVVISKYACNIAKDSYSDEKRKREQWRRECLQNDNVKQLFQMWESQIIGDVAGAQKKATARLTEEENKLLDEKIEIIIDESNGKKFVKGGKLTNFVQYATSHIVTDLECVREFTTALLMTHHSFTTSIELMDQLLKRYEVTPPYGLSQRMFEIYLDKKIVQIRLKVCNILYTWINTHFEEDFVDNEPLLLR